MASEIVEGTLTRSPNGEYTGTFTRRTHLLFCGAHGVSAKACALVLDGEGLVAVQGLSWRTSEVRAAEGYRRCGRPRRTTPWKSGASAAAEFKQGVQRMYLTARHGAEFALPAAGAAPSSERLEDYAWIVEVS